MICDRCKITKYKRRSRKIGVLEEKVARLYRNAGLQLESLEVSASANRQRMTRNFLSFWPPLLWPRTAAGGCCCCLILGARPLSISDNRASQHVVCRLCPSLCTDSESAIPFSKSSIIVAACPVYGCNVLKHHWDQHFRPPGMPFLRIAPTLQAT